MKNVITQHSPSAVEYPTVASQFAIENALSMALYYVRQPAHSPAMMQAATGRANRALTLLKQACSASRSTSHGADV